ncbi:MAG TPA: SDR family NAD(P)-dependent oxidoreductase [Solimonas sp.]
MKQFDILGLTPADLAHPGLAVALSRNGAAGLLDLEFAADAAAAERNFAQLLDATSAPCGLRVTATRADLARRLLDGAGDRALTLILAGPAETLPALRSAAGARPQDRCLAELTDPADAPRLDAHFDGLVARGHEAGGWVGSDSSYILLQKLIRQIHKPLFVQGGIGLRAAAACRAAGAAGVVLDDALLLMAESPLPAALQNELARLNGAECKPLGELLNHSCRVYARPGSAALKLSDDETRLAEGGALHVSTWVQQMQARIGWHAERLLPLGQGIGLAAGYRARYRSAGRLVQAVRRATQQQVERAAELHALDENGPLAQSHGTRYPLAQGPMTRVSDSPAFAAEVAKAGALPFLALALMRGPQVREMLEQTRTKVPDGQPWGVGLLGFVPQALREEQCAEVWACKPSFALIAGGRPDQAAEFESRGIPTYIHAPAPALLKLYLEQGARRFVFEGRECGGHVGPIASFPLWEQMIDVLLEQVSAADAKSVHVLFAGGIHDALSGAMVAAMTAPLAERGMKVGCLMGTAYLFTQEIVGSGAIVPTFQDEALRCTHTLNLESGPGHASRCVDTQFARDFYEERRRLIRDNRSVDEIRDALEDLNLGRLRIASKGLDRDTSGKVVVVPEDKQRTDGMYMIGQVATLRDRVQPVAELHEDVTVGAQRLLDTLADARTEHAQHADPSDIAIVGIGVTLPRANTPDDYWELILKQTSVLREAPHDRWDPALMYDPDPKARDKVYSKWGGFLDEIAFDPLKFGIPPKSMKSIDPLQLLTLETAARTLSDAGYADGGFDRETASVILGAGGGAGDLGQQYAMRAELPRFVEHLSPEVWERLPEWTEESFAGTLLNVAAGRVANRLDFGGVNYTVDAACGSSLAAIGLAVHELETRRSNLVLAGGFDTTQSAFAFMAFAKTQALSATGKPRTFDQAADGIAISEGVAMVALKRLADAERDGDRIYAVIKATAGSSDGKALGLTAPRVEGQVRALKRAYAKASFSPATLDLVEAHGTGTPVGDRTEAQTVSRALSDAGAAPKSAAIGSVKTILGHTKAAAGASGLIKVALSLYHRTLPGHHGVDRPIDVVADPNAPIYLLKDARPWLAPVEDHPRRGAASAFGFGGTNFHAVLEEYRGNTGSAGGKRWPCELFLFRAADTDALTRELERVRDALPDGSPLQAGELAQALAREADLKRGQPVALAIVAADLAALKKDLNTALAQLREGENTKLPPQMRLNRALPKDSPAVAFLFPGQGAQHVNMGRETALHVDELRSALELAEATLKTDLPERLSARIYPPAAFDAETEAQQTAAITDTRYAQPAIGALSLGYLRFAQRMGLSAIAAAGHSYGEYSALMAAGVLAPADFLRLSAVRGRAMAEAAQVSQPGGMAAVQAARDAVTPLIAEFAGVRIANHNAPEQSVISGPRAELERAVEKLSAAGLRAVTLPVSGAFHTELVAPAKTALSQAIHATRFAPAQFAVFSNATGQPYPADAGAMQAQLDEHLLSSVEFVADIEALYAAGARVFLELGPRGICAALVRQILADKPDAKAVSLDTGMQGLKSLQLGLAELFVNGVNFDASALYAGRELPLLDLARLRERAALPVLPKHVWMLSGGCARAQDETERRTGKLPALTKDARDAARAKLEAQMEAAIRARLPAGAPAATPGTAALPANTALSSEALIAYQQTMRQFLALQERVVQQFIGGGAVPVMPAGVAMPMLPAMPSPVAPAVASSPAVTIAPPAPVTVTAAVARAPAATLDFKSLLLGIVADRTGYPTDMLGLDADLEADLGIDSIKRVEIIGGLRKALPDAIADGVKQRMERYTKAKTLNAILAELQTLAPAVANVTVATPNVTVEVAVAATPALDFKALLLGIVADRTGYPTDMLGLDADLEADLGIDSIKRVEIIGGLRKALPDALADGVKQRMERYTKAKTLNTILAELQTLAPAPAAPAVVTATVSAAPVAAAAIDYRELLLHIVADRTGYPTDMLGLDADLEADLGIDSIKRVEIIGGLRKALPDALADGVKQRMERYTKAKTLNAILAELQTLAPAQAASVVAAEAVTVVEAPAASTTALPRYVIKSRPAPLPGASVELQGLAAVLAPEGVISSALTQVLSARGLTPVLITATESDALRAQLATARDQHGPVRALIHLHGLETADASDLAAWRAIYRRDLMSLFHATQACLTDIEAGARVIAACRLGGTFGRDAVGEGGPLAGGVNGILNCLRIEAPACVARAVDFDGHSDQQVVALLAAELFAYDRETEAGYIGLERYGAATLEQSLAASPFGSQLTPDGSWVLLATGGARGITAQIIETLVKPGMRLVLLGRTAEPAAEDEATARHTDNDALKKALLSARLARGERPKPVEIDREVSRIQVDRELRANLARLRAAGAVVDYRAVDARDEIAFGALIDELYAQHGRIDAVIHGAGVIEDKLLADKAADSFERVLGTKLDPAFVLTQKLKPESLKLLALFTSVAGRYGNRGQTDYAAANEALNRLAWDLHRRWTHTRVMAINWGPWDGGMASEGIKRQLRERGMEPIPVPAGCHFFLDELLNGPRHDVELVAGKGPWGDLAIAASETVAPVTSGGVRHAFVRKPARVGVGGAITLDHRLTLADDPWLRDHVIDGQPVVPLAVALETMAQFVAQNWPGWQVAEVRDLRMLATLAVDPEAGTDIQLRAKAATHSEPGSQSVTVQFGSARRGEEPWFRATIVLLPALPAPVAAQLAGLSELDPMDATEAYAKHLCRGERLRAVQRVGALAANGAVATLKPSSPAQFVAGSDADWLFDPALLDALTQLAFVWAQQHHRQGVLPQRLGRVRRYGSAAPQGPLTLVQHFVPGRKDELLVAAAELVDSTGALRYVVDEIESTMNAALNRLAPSSPDYVQPAVGGKH